MLIDSSSYGPSPYLLWQRYVASYFDCMYPQYTNHIQDISQGGSDWQADWKNNWQKWGLARMASFPVPFSVLVLPDDNGSLLSNDIVHWGTNMAASPPLFWNGSASADAGVSCQPFTYYFLGGILADSTDQSAPTSREAGSTNLNSIFQTPVVPLFSQLSAGGWTDDRTGARKLGFYDGGHPLPAGHLCMAIQILVDMGVETNVGTLTFDYRSAIAYTNSFTASGVTLSGNILSATIRADRMPMGWDVPDGTITNDARDAFVVMPSLGNAFRWIMQVTNLPTGIYNCFIDGALVDTATSAQWTAGRNWFTNYNGSFWTQRGRTVQVAICQENGTDPVTLAETHNAGSFGAHGVGDIINWKSHGNNFYDTLGQRGSTLVASMVADAGAMNTNAVFTHTAAMQTTHTFTFQPQLLANVATNRSGTVHYGL